MSTVRHVIVQLPESNVKIPFSYWCIPEIMRMKVLCSKKLCERRSRPRSEVIHKYMWHPVQVFRVRPKILILHTTTHRVTVFWLKNTLLWFSIDHPEPHWPLVTLSYSKRWRIDWKKHNISGVDNLHQEIVSISTSTSLIVVCLFTTGAHFYSNASHEWICSPTGSNSS